MSACGLDECDIAGCQYGSDPQSPCYAGKIDQEDRNKKIVDCYRDGYSGRQIGAMMGITHQTVFNILRRQGEQVRLPSQKKGFDRYVQGE